MTSSAQVFTAEDQYYNLPIKAGRQELTSAIIMRLPVLTMNQENAAAAGVRFPAVGALFSLLSAIDTGNGDAAATLISPNASQTPMPAYLAGFSRALEPFQERKLTGLIPLTDHQRVLVSGVENGVVGERVFTMADTMGMGAFQYAPEFAVDPDQMLVNAVLKDRTAARADVRNPRDLFDAGTVFVPLSGSDAVQPSYETAGLILNTPGLFMRPVLVDVPLFTPDGTPTQLQVSDAKVQRVLDFYQSAYVELVEGDGAGFVASMGERSAQALGPGISSLTPDEFAEKMAFVALPRRVSFIVDAGPISMVFSSSIPLRRSDVGENGQVPSVPEDGADGPQYPNQQVEFVAEQNGQLKLVNLDRVRPIEAFFSNQDVQQTLLNTLLAN